MIVVLVLMISCQVSDQPKIGPAYGPDDDGRQCHAKG